MTSIQTPALDVLVGIISDTDGYSLDADGTPCMCPGCPFAGQSIEPYDEIWHDITEAHYPCSLLNKTVWGEYTCPSIPNERECKICKKAYQDNWRARSRARAAS